MTDRFNKLDKALMHYVSGAKWVMAAKAYSFAKSYHTGTRKDNITPEFQHQIEGGLYIITLRDTLMNPERALSAFLLHDVEEDYGVDRSLIAYEFDDELEEDVWALTKEYRGIKKSTDQYFTELALRPNASIGKGVDRTNNQQTMTGVFTREKQFSYLTETEDNILPMLKEADHRFPEQHLAYMNVRFVLKSQAALIKAALEGTQEK